MSKHSILPWYATDHVEPRCSVLAADGTTVVPPRYKDGAGRCDADLDLIVKAVNCHHDLYAAVVAMLPDLKHKLTVEANAYDHITPEHSRLSRLVAQAESALSKSRGEEYPPAGGDAA